jgi:ferric-dicitrate binding protein FerR (iron transport regulator)
MDGSESQAAREVEATSDENLLQQRAGTEAHDAANRAAEGLKGQIAALRQQVKDAQDTLRDHQRRRGKRAPSNARGGKLAVLIADGLFGLVISLGGQPRP